MKRKTVKLNVAILVPAINEEFVLAKTLQSIQRIVPNKDIYVVNDGSTDKTARVARGFTRNVFSTRNQGKANALNTGISHYKLTKKYNFIFFMDADTRPASDYLESALPHFENDPKKKVVCVVGRVKGQSTNWVSKYRQWEYQISHLIHKKAQGLLGSIIVVPGCATIYRSFVFDKLKFPTGTLTEDMDFTFLMHRKSMNKMVFEPKAVVYTQDPQNLRDLIKQLRRWYTGFWQVVRKHNIPWQGQMLDLEVSMLALEGLYNGLVVAFFLFSLIPISIIGNLNIFKIPLILDLTIFFLPSLIWSSIEDKDYKRILYIPAFYFLRFLSSVLFLESFFRGFLSQEKEYIWNSNRYLEKEGL